MGCFLVIACFMAPRLVLFFIWLLTDWIGQAYQTVIWPFLGFIFMPFTTLVYMGAMNDSGELSEWWFFLFVLALLADLSSSGSMKIADDGA